MQAIVFHDHGGPEVLRAEDVPQPTPGPGEVLLRVRAISVSRTLDCEVRSRPGAFGPIPMPHILGPDPAGEVAQLGEGVQEFQPGDRVVSQALISCGVCRPCVMGQNNACARVRIQGVHTQGGDAEYMLTPARNLFRLPDDLSFEEATAMMTMAPTAWHLLIDRAQLRPGETVLILAAGGALGTAGIQVAKLAGARVIAAAGADWNGSSPQEKGISIELSSGDSKMFKTFALFLEGLFRGYNDACGGAAAGQANLSGLQQLRGEVPRHGNGVIWPLAWDMYCGAAEMGEFHDPLLHGDIQRLPTRPKLFDNAAIPAHSLAASSLEVDTTIG